MTHQDRLDRILAVLPDDDAAWLSARLDPPQKQRARRLDTRDDAIREALALLGTASPTGAACELERRLRRYLAGTAWQAERESPALPEGADPLRWLLHRIARANLGRGLGWRQLMNVRAGERRPASL